MTDPRPTAPEPRPTDYEGEARNALQGLYLMSKNDPVDGWRADAAVSAIEARLAHLEAERDEALAARDEALRQGGAQAEEWDRYWTAIGIGTPDISVDDAIELWRRRERERDAARDAIAALVAAQEAWLPWTSGACDEEYEAAIGRVRAAWRALVTLAPEPHEAVTRWLDKYDGHTAPPHGAQGGAE